MGCVGGGGGGGKEEMPQCVDNPPQLLLPIWLVIVKIQKLFDNPSQLSQLRCPYGFNPPQLQQLPIWVELRLSCPYGFRDQRLPTAHLYMLKLFGPFLPFPFPVVLFGIFNTAWITRHPYIGTHGGFLLSQRICVFLSVVHLHSHCSFCSINCIN